MKACSERQILGNRREKEIMYQSWLTIFICWGVVVDYLTRGALKSWKLRPLICIAWFHFEMMNLKNQGDSGRPENNYPWRPPVNLQRALLKQSYWFNVQYFRHYVKSIVQTPASPVHRGDKELNWTTSKQGCTTWRAQLNCESSWNQKRSRNRKSKTKTLSLV